MRFPRIHVLFSFLDTQHLGILRIWYLGLYACNKVNLSSLARVQQGRLNTSQDSLAATETLN